MSVIITTAYEPPPPAISESETAIVWTLVAVVLAAVIGVVLWLVYWPPAYDTAKRLRRRAGRKERLVQVGAPFPGPRPGRN
jgi:low temperature requirement protein LtrA